MVGFLLSLGLVAVGIVGLVALISLSLSYCLPLMTKGYRDGPLGTFGWPLLGETLNFLKPHASFQVGKYLETHCSRYGKVFKSHLFGSPTIVSCDHEMNAFILQSEGKLIECSYPKPIHGILGESSMLVVAGEKHKRLRTLALQLVVTSKGKIEYLNDIERNVVLIMDSWKDKKQIGFISEARKFTFSVIVKQILSLSPDDPITCEILSNILTFMKGLVSLPVKIPGTPYAKAVEARERISKMLQGCIDSRRKEKDCTKGDFLDTLLLSNDLCGDNEKVSLVLDLLLGGYETTSTLMALVLHFLGQSPCALQQLKEEHDRIRSGKKKDEFLTWEDYKQMEFTQNVINETLRCGNIVKFVHRKALKDIHYKGYFIPAGWKVLPILSAVHLDPSLHDDVEQFKPWRWQENQHAASKKFIPFGGGGRFCPGSDLARVETALFLHHLVLNYRWSRPSSSGDHEEDVPMAHPYVEFHKGLPIQIQRI